MTFTRLTLGEPRLKGRPKGGTQEPGGCEEPIVAGSNILPDPGFELSPSDPAGYGFAFPTDGTGSVESLYWWDDGAEDFGDWASEVPDTVYYKTVNAGTPIFGDQLKESGVWVLSTANPRSGSSHIRQAADSTAFIENDYIVPAIYACDLSDPNGNPGYASARIGAGQVLDASYYITSSDGGGGHQAEISLLFLDSSWSFVSGTTSSTPTLTTSYQEVSLSIVAPSGAYFAIVEFGWITGTTSVGMTVDIDDITVGVTL